MRRGWEDKNLGEVKFTLNQRAGPLTCAGHRTKDLRAVTSAGVFSISSFKGPEEVSRERYSLGKLCSNEASLGAQQGPFLNCCLLEALRVLKPPKSYPGKQETLKATNGHC